MKRWITLYSVSVLVFSVLSGCGSHDAPAPVPPPDVTVSRPLEKEVTDNIEFTGTTSAVESVEIRARVKGFLERIAFEPGAKVKAGDLLFVIDRRPFKAQVDQAAATVASNKAQLELAEVRVTKTKNLYATASVSEIQLLEEQAKRDVEKAQLDMARAKLESAQLELDFTEVKAPIGGRAGVNLVDVGNLVGAGDNTLLTQVVKDDSIYVYFNVSERDLLKYKRKYLEIRTGEGQQKEDPKAYLALADERDYPHEGVIDYMDPKVDPSTGTVRLRAVFSNSKGLLMAGLFARIRIPVETRKAFLIPDLAVGIDQRGEYVLLVNKDNVVEYRPVEVGQLVERMRVIEKGVSTDDSIIVNGIQRARPGSKVNPLQSPPATKASAPATPQSPGK
ncbi:MAG: efflux RND transporter periplasmic adaptor subunit [Desulfomonile tiedjei]|uniref:Efflux RND transporter periplasmic adaptor subunit n=1 Tax=Desulfomonile tiedjei TaxID=2358 RepID=A0A9D6Z286_9BACT|nr:efflux RND transporter periplasmic adaptor subunit [Desulfomonile tiedjei]